MVVKIGLIFLISFPFLWIFIGWTLAQFSGWAQLSQHYASDTPMPKNTLKFRSMAMGYTPIFRVSYSNILHIGADDTYLYLSVFRLFRIGAKPLQIPFDEMEMDDGLMIFIKTKRIKTHKVPKITIIMTARLVEKIDQLRVGL